MRCPVWWFPITQATLDAHYREISAQVFENVSQTSGRDVLVSMSVILGRIEALERGDFGEDGKQARELLAGRGLTAEVAREAQALVDSVSQTAQSPAEPGVSPEELQAAEDHMWAWYREWGRIARTVIDSRGQLRKLGFLNARGTVVEVDDEGSDVDEPVAQLPDNLEGLALESNESLGAD
jgi:hypothetical protein